MASEKALYAIAQLRHAYKQLYEGSVYRQREFAEGLLGPAIADLEAELTPTMTGSCSECGGSGLADSERSGFIYCVCPAGKELAIRERSGGIAR